MGAPTRRGPALSGRPSNTSTSQGAVVASDRTALLAAEIGEGLLVNLDPDQAHAVAMYLLDRIEVVQ